ncbi:MULTISPECIES: LuxR family transcriptional regulator [unclassified Serratia (in: enterobacteria)]|uniref:helix-turn-helix transcriptional regulator n=1 Tax=unclassified Serratia (in: enterobacteria) TaxID=2647522 RepID=UPI0005065D3C|nr:MULTISPECIES: LuxR family transcriptional regulator [unclassified Serratia (in: enterobacteria)]KFK92069.1 hypothetical protein JV45_22660 [Serratia sp. Ag2]KFK96189.1 hypothetical protein IV04_19295 [Serratia sp. Ag1]
MRKGKIVIQSPCHFTSIGIETLFNHSLYTNKPTELVTFKTLEECKEYCVSVSGIDILILALNGKENNLAPLINFISNTLPITHPKTKVLLLVHGRHTEFLSNYLSRNGNISAILDISSPLKQIQKVLDNVFNGVKEDINANISLSLRELSVLNGLLSGRTPIQIANELRLSIKTVSHYKRAALAKLGLPSLHPIFMQCSIPAVTSRYRRVAKIDTQSKSCLPKKQGELIEPPECINMAE